MIFGRSDGYPVATLFRNSLFSVRSNRFAFPSLLSTRPLFRSSSVFRPTERKLGLPLRFNSNSYRNELEYHATSLYRRDNYLRNYWKQIDIQYRYDVFRIIRRKTLNNFLDRFLPRMRKFYARRAALKKALDRSGLALQVR